MPIETLIELKEDLLRWTTLIMSTQYATRGLVERDELEECRFQEFLEEKFEEAVREYACALEAVDG